MENAKKLVNSMHGDQVCILADNLGLDKPALTEIIIDLLKNGKRILYVSTYAKDDAVVKAINSIRGINKGNFIYKDNLLKYDVYNSICSKNFEEIIRIENVEKYDYIFINDVYTDYKLLSDNTKKTMEKASILAKCLNTPIICSIFTYEYLKNGENVSISNSTISKYLSDVSIIITVKLITRIKVQISTYDLRPTTTNNSYYNLDNNRDFVPGTSKFGELFKVAETLGFNILEAYNYAKDWYTKEGDI